MLDLFFVAMRFILRGDLCYVLPCVILFLGKKELILELFVRLFDLCLFGFVGFLFLLVPGKGCCLRLWHSLDFSLTFFVYGYASLFNFTKAFRASDAMTAYS